MNIAVRSSLARVPILPQVRKILHRPAAPES
jgi:hypothetical protein